MTVGMPAAIGGDRKRGPASASARVVPGSTRAGLARQFAALGFTRGAEVGVADGRFSLVLCESIPGLELYCVDPWQKYSGNPRGGPQEQHDRNYALAWERLRPYPGAYLWRMTSMEAAQQFTWTRSDGRTWHDPLSFVYIDGNHCFDYVMRDLIEWSKIVRPGGIVAGHDYYDFAHAGVVAAVDAYTAAHGITEWHLTDEREPSFWWVRP